MDTSSHARSSISALFVTVLLSGVVALSGCLGDGGRNDDGAAAMADSRLLVSLVGLEAPEGEEGLVLNVTIDHIALRMDGKWVAVIAAPASTEVVFTSGIGDPAFLVDVPVPAGSYTDVEVIATGARVTTASGSQSATVEEVACYSRVSVTVPEEGVAELQLVVSGPEALESSEGAWVFRPAVVGSFAPEDGSGEATLEEPDCRAY
ncbi:MAG: hypothetical protein KY455_06625 [Euryarchaeota archaeon]|nr:hypothetical protein [Euryarchaeota archaeon]